MSKPAKFDDIPPSPYYIIMDIKHNVVGWFEVSVSDRERAIRFYEAVFGFKLLLNRLGLLDMACRHLACDK